MALAPPTTAQLRAAADRMGLSLDEAEARAYAALMESAVAAYGVIDRMELVQGDLLAPLLADPTTRANESLHYLVSNPPYIPDHEWDAVEPNVKDHEPHLALRAGSEGLDFVAPLIEDAPRLLRSGGLLLIEIASSTADKVLALAEAQPQLEGARVLPDIDNLPRVLVASKRPAA
jgi:release factor glutamine methyltransferase